MTGRTNAISIGTWVLQQQGVKKAGILGCKAVVAEFCNQDTNISLKKQNVKFDVHTCEDETMMLIFFLCSYKPILEYIDTQFEKYLEEELKIKRSLFNCHDTRIHICLYFIAPTGHSLKSLDLVTMKKLDSKVTTESGTG